MEKEYISVNDKIFELLKNKDVSQKELSDLTGISTSAISDWKHKGSVPSAVNIQKICKALDINPEELLGTSSFHISDTYIIKEDDELYEFVSLYDKATSDIKKRILAYINGIFSDERK